MIPVKVATIPSGVYSRVLFSDPATSPAETWVTELRDYPEWHRGRARYGLWLVPVHDAALLAYIEYARQRLADLFHPGLQRQPHLTVFVCGFEQPRRVADDDFTPDQWQQQVECISAARGSRCSLPLGPLDSFVSAAFIPVGDPDGQLLRWRAALGQAGPEIRQAAYVPHITLGLYRCKVTAEVVRQRLGDIDPPAMRLRVDELHYATYAAQLQFGPLQTRHCLALQA